MEFSIDINKVKQSKYSLQEGISKTRYDAARMESIARSLRYADDTALHIMSIKLMNQVESLEREVQKMKILLNGLDRVLQIYEQEEENACMYVAHISPIDMAALGIEFLHRKEHTGHNQPNPRDGLFPPLITDQHIPTYQIPEFVGFLGNFDF